MSEHQDGKAERIAQYKEERRKQLKCQLYANSDSSIIAARHSKHTNSSSSEGPRTTRASRLRAAAASQESASSPSQENKLKSQEKTLISPTSTPNLGGSSGSRYAARDKSNKRKSNLNRSLNCEEIPGSDAEDSKSRRRRRRFFPPELLEQATNNNSSNEDHNKSASFIHRSNTPPTTHSPISTHITAPRKSELSIHMENARKGITPSYSEMGKHKSIVKRAKESSHTENKKSTIVHNSETTKHHTLETQPITANNGIAKKLEELTALTKSTLARVEKLASKNKESPKLLKKFDSKSLDKSVPTSSILKKNVSGSLVSEYVPNTTTPVSILKRKVSQDEHKLESMSSMPTPPVTFSPSVVEPAITKRKQGILKKRRSLDESQVMRHRSCSPTVANKPEDSRSILKNQRRSSLEELTVLQSPELHLHSILKRKSLKSEEDDSLSSPQGILKRRSGSSSAGSTCASSHVSITTAVILAAASGAEMVLDPEAVRPILKKKYLSEDHSISENSSEAPRPILKKKSSTDTDDDERPKKTILKFSRGSIDYDKSDFNGDKQNIPTNDDVQRILKQTSFKEESVKPKLHFSSERNDKNEEVVLRHKHERRTNLVSAGFSAHESIEVKEEDRELTKPRPLSVFDLVRNFENFSTGAIPKRIHSKRTSDRYKTQPVTSNELEASLHFVNAQLDAIPKFATHSSLDNESNLASFVCSGRNSDRGVSGKMSSDSAFQSLGDGLELEQEVALVPKKLEASKLELQMRAIALEAQNKKLGQAKYSRKSGVQDKRPSRFSTQPVTSQEVKKASGISESTEEKDEASIDDRRGILKSSASSRPRSSLKKRDGVDDIDNTSHQSILRTGAPEDEGISCNDSASDTEIFGAATSKVARAQNRKIASKLEQKSGDTTSEGESSGGREITNIFNSEKKLKVKQALESALFKSNSQSTFRNEKEPVNTKVTIRRSHTHSTMPQKIAELQAKLQKTGETGWKSRVQLNNTSNNELKLLKDTHHNNNELSLSSKKDDLDAASKQWKCRVEKSDADNFSVAGRMEKNRDGDRLLLNIPSGDSAKKTPEARRFKGKLQGTDSSSTPVSPDKAKSSSLIRSQSVPDPNRDPPELEKTGRKVAVTRPDDFTFTNFYTRLEVTESSQQLQLTLDDLDTVPRQSLLIQRKNVQAQKRRGATKNPVKALASRPDVMDEYTEVITGVAEKAKRKLNLEKLSKGSNLAIEALAGLASTEDFTSVALKKSSFSQSMVPFKPIMLLQVKGRRHVQTRLVEPIPSSINEGDCFILVTANCIYNYTGEYSNVIEQSRASDIVNSIQQTSDLGCKAVKTINLDKNSPITEKFWSSLGSEESIVDGGHPDEDEIYETNIIATNMIYHMDGDELVPFDGYWGSIPKFEILQGDAVLVFDFGSEMYVWSGKTAQISKKRMVLKLAKDLWDEGYDYSECTVCPLNVASILGNRSSEKAPLKSTKRPDWALFAKITQHRETILFKEKFLDWPDFSRIIRVKSIDSDKSPSSPNISPCDVKEMLKMKENEPDLIVEGHHLGRGDSYTDEETRRIFQFDTLDTKKWRILVNQPEELFDTSLGHFYDADSYIVKWNYKMTVKGRELNGKPSKHIQAGRDRCIYFCWQGCNSSINEKGFAALLTVELDSENSPQIRVVEGAEPAAFLRLFNGSMVIHSGKRDKSADLDKARLFILKGEHECEVFLTEVPCENQSLRSRTSFLLIDSQSARIIIWHGCKSDTQKKKLAKSIANNIVKKKEAEFYLEDAGCVEVTEVNEGTESEEFFDLIGKERVYFSLVNSDLQYNYTLRLFSLSSISGTFEATELLCPYRCGNSSPYPFLQQDLYSSSQPALFLIDNYHELWLWQGWWPEREEEMDLSDQAGAIRWHSERKAAMQTAINYWQKNHADEKVQVFLVWAGLEPREFKNLFPSWIDKEDIAELNEKEKRKAIERVSAVTELARLSRTTYPLQELMERPLPDGVDPTHLEIYLSPDDFREILELTKEEFQKLPSWKQTAIKKEKGLF